MATVLVIGASRGIGRGVVQACLERGDRVIATVRKADDAQALRAAGAEVLVVDVAQPASVSGLAWQLDGVELDQAWDVAGAWDGASAHTPPTQQDFDRVMHTNVLGLMQVLPQVMPCVEAAGGTMVCISSMMSRLSQAEAAPGCTAPAKQRSTWWWPAPQDAWKSTRVVAMDPGWVQTEMGGPARCITVEETRARHAGTRWRNWIEADKGALVRYDGHRCGSW